MMNRIALVNMKGGCGKTTIATCLAAYYANKGIKTSLTDYDPQGSSINWLKHRGINRPAIHGIDIASQKRLANLAWQLRPPLDTKISIIDTPAGIESEQLRKIIAPSDTILIPVMQSQIDIRTATRFIEILLVQGRVRVTGKNIGIIANRVYSHTSAYKSLKKFLMRLDIPLVARLRSAQCYINAIDNGIGIHELNEEQAFKEQYQWDKLTTWLEEKKPL